MAEHLEPDALAVRPTDVVLADEIGDSLHLLQVQFAGEDHNVGPLGIVAHGLAVAHVDLGGDVHLHADVAGKQDGGHVAGDDGAHLGVAGGGDNLVHVVDVLVIDDGVDRQVTLHAVLVAPLGDGVQVLEREVDARARPHVQPFDAKVDGIGTALLGGI